MALATQCPHCFTIFRVAGDQLKLRGGLVRCGSCRQVFNGEEYLVEASVADGHYQPAPGSKARFGSAMTSSPQSPSAPVVPDSGPTIPEVQARVAAATALASSDPSTPSAGFTSAPAAPAGPAAGTPGSRPEPIPAIPEPKVFRSPTSPGYIPDLGAPLKQPDFQQQPRPAPAQTPPAPEEDINTAALLRRSSTDDDTGSDDNLPTLRHDGDTRIEPGFSDEEPFAAGRDAAHAESTTDPEDGQEQDKTREEEERENADEAATEEDDEEDDEEDPADAPAFVKSAERKERISHVLKMVMMILAGVMVPVLLLQATYYWRNQLAVAAPPLRPMLVGMCNVFHCNVGLPAEIERLTLESNELQVVPPNQNIYALALVLRNRGTGPQAWPHIELTLNNDDEKAVVRRVFRPREYLASPQLLEAGIAGESEQQVKLTFELNEAVVSGYRIYLFYP